MREVKREAGCGSAWLERLVWDQEAAGSNPVTPIKKRISTSGSVVEYRLAKARVAGSNPVSCSLKSPDLLGFFYFVLYFMLHDILKVVVYHIVYFFSFLRKCLHVYFFHHII